MFYVFWRNGLRHAANVRFHFKSSEQLEPEYSRKQPMCMASYKYLFNSTRLPVSPADIPFKADPALHNYVVVVRKNKFFKVPVVDAQGEFLSERDLESLFAEVVKVAGPTAAENPLGALTAGDRDLWTTVSPLGVKSALWL